MEQTSNVQPASAVLDGLRRGERSTLNAQLESYSKLDVGRWTPARDLSELSVERFPSPTK
jgi:hypothetical protein